MRKVRVELGDRAYDIRIGHELSFEFMRKPGVRVLIVSDSNVDPLYGEECGRVLEGAGAGVFRMVVPAGELSKDLSCVRSIYDRALECGLDRGSVIVALGGGVVGDLAGFAAATYMRGVSYVQVPTSLLAMVDSSVGGKTGVNLPQGKNLIGAFYQPAEVVMDLRVLKTLPDREYVSGLAEVVKYGVIRDANLFQTVEENIDPILGRDMDFMEVVIARCCEIKAEVVAGDERESGFRAILNFGHTFAHALEKISGYDSWLHGEAVAVGMVYAARLSVRQSGLAADAADRIEALLDRLGMPANLKRGGSNPEWKDLRTAMSFDKKSAGAKPKFVLATSIGSVVHGCEVEEGVMEEVYRDIC